VNPDAAALSAGFQQQHAILAALGQPGGERATRGSRSDDDVIELRLAHAVCPVEAQRSGSCMRHALCHASSRTLSTNAWADLRCSCEASNFHARWISSQHPTATASQSCRSIPAAVFWQSLEPFHRLAGIYDGAVPGVDLEKIDQVRKLRAIEAALLDGEDREAM
jgi:hypothetical protein